jgi:hypothetical protein
VVLVVVEAVVVVVVAGAVEGGVSVVGSLATVVVDIGANVEVVDASSPEADWHPAARKASTAANRRGRRICIGLRCYGRYCERWFFGLGAIGIIEPTLHCDRGFRGLYMQPKEPVNICGRVTIESLR